MVPASETSQLRAHYLSALVDLLSGADRKGKDALADALTGSFRLALLDAVERHGGADGAARVSSPLPSGQRPDVGLPALVSPATSPSAPAGEDAIIRETAQRAGIDPEFLKALRRTENGGPGREFGVLSVPAPTYHAQARVAAETVRRNVARFEQGGGRAIDPTSGRYTPEFIAFFSSRYAPVGAANDPGGLNRFHARNLTRLYADVSTAGA